MDIRVFHKRLKNHRGHECIQNFRIDGHVAMNLSRESHLLDRQIHLDKLNLVSQRNEFCFASVESHTQHAAHLFQHAVGGLHVGVHQAGDAVHRVEKKVWIQLHAQGAQLRIGQLRFQSDGSVFPFPEFLVVTNATKQEEDDPEGKEVADQFGINKIDQPMQESHGATSHAKVPCDCDPDDLFENADEDTQRGYACEDLLERGTLSPVTQLPPDDPADNAPEQKMNCPKQVDLAKLNVVIPGTRFRPFLERKKNC